MIVTSYLFIHFELRVENVRNEEPLFVESAVRVLCIYIRDDLSMYLRKIASNLFCCFIMALAICSLRCNMSRRELSFLLYLRGGSLFAYYAKLGIGGVGGGVGGGGTPQSIRDFQRVRKRHLGGHS